MNFIHCFQAEWLKKKGSLASWLVIIGGFFTPMIIIVVRIIYHSSLKSLNADPKFWEKHWINSWESMSIFMLPMGIILSASLMAQLEYKNNTWKQWHTTPQMYSTLFFSKLAVIIVMMLQFFLLFNIGIYLSAVIPGMFFSDVHYPAGSIPFRLFAEYNFYYFICCLPMIAIQYLVSLQFKNFLVAVGGGIALWIASIAALSWKFGYTIPYTHGALYYLKTAGRYKQDAHIAMWAIAYFAAATLISYYLYLTKKEKG
jgi:hypothetical protein